MADDTSLIEGLDDLKKFRENSQDPQFDIKALERKEREPMVRSSMMQASQTDPATAVKDKRLIDETGMTPDMIALDPEYMERMANFKKAYPLASKARPATFKWLTDPYNSSVSQNDIDAFDKLEEKLTITKRAKEDATIYTPWLWDNKIGDYARSFTASVHRTTGMSMAGFGAVAQAQANEGEVDPFDYAPDLNTMTAMMPNFSAVGMIFDYLTTGDEQSAVLRSAVGQEAKDMLGFNPIKIDRDTQELLRSTGKFAERVGQNVIDIADTIDIPEYKRGLDTEIVGALGMMANQIALTMVASPIAHIQMFGIGAYEQAQRFEESGVEPRADLLLKGGAVTALLEKAGIDMIMNRLPPMIKSKVMNWIADVTIAGGVEWTEELLEMVAHNALQMEYDDEAKLLDIDFRELTVAGGAGAIMRALLRAGGSKRLQMNQGREQDSLDEIIDTIKSTETNELDPNVTASHIQAVMDEHGMDSDIYISAEGLSEVIDSLDQSMPVVQEMKAQLEEANEVTGDVVVPAKDVLSHMVKDGQIETLRPYIRMNQDSLTRQELEEMTADRRQQVDEILEQGMKDAQLRNEAREVEQDIAGQLYDTGQMSKREARISSKLMGAYATRLAERMDISVLDAYAEMGVIVRKGNDKTRIATKNGVMYSQNFGEVQIEEDVINSETGKRGKMKIDAQTMWDDEVKNSKGMQSLMECLNG